MALRYADREPDLADLCLIRLSELNPRHPVITTDWNDFRVYRRGRREAIPCFTLRHKSRAVLLHRQQLRASRRQMLIRRVQHDRSHGVIADDGGQFQRSLLAECLNRFGIKIGTDPVLMERVAGEGDEQRVAVGKTPPYLCCT